jgi:predicted nucleic acid-binding Zn ribbon protein
VACDISQRAGPDVRPITPHSLCIYCGKNVSPATTLTSDVPSHHLIRPVQSAGRRCQGHPADGTPVQSIDKQCARAERRTELIIPSMRSLPGTPKTRRSRVSGHKKIAPAANVCSPKCYILYVPVPTCRGSGPLCMSPFSYKRGGVGDHN